MVCNRCILIVESQLKKGGFKISSIELGEIELKKTITPEQKKIISQLLVPFGFKIIDDKKSKLIETIKKQIINLIHYSTNKLKVNLSTHLSKELNYDYTYLSNLFSEVEHTTIEHYYIAQKIEKVKELLMDDELNLNEIADSLNYSSNAYLSNQFKKITGFSPTQFKQLKQKKRKSLDKV